jgi:hypothetical protein
MENFLSVPLSLNGRPMLLDEEVECKSEDGVSVVLQDHKNVLNQILSPGSLIITNFRIIVTQRTVVSSDTGWGILLKNVSFVEDCAKIFSRSTRIRLCFKSNTKEVGFKFNNYDKTDTLNKINDALTRKMWVNMSLKSVAEVGAHHLLSSLYIF